MGLGFGHKVLNDPLISIGKETGGILTERLDEVKVEKN
jgi:hypothetical protein